MQLGGWEMDNRATTMPVGRSTALIINKKFALCGSSVVSAEPASTTGASGDLPATGDDIGRETVGVQTRHAPTRYQMSLSMC